jgi:ectoine hydroxylase-related dioxygenase (phytanoyl-CoA dioxygenase family)
MYEDVWANKPASTVLSAILGPRPRVNYVNGNTALGGYDGARQRVHADLTFNHAEFPFAIVTNYYLIDVSPANGSTELWLGSHRDTSFRDHRNCVVNSRGKPDEYDKKIEGEFGIREELLEKRRQYAPPIQPTVKKGSVVLRDLRLWHAGLANPTPDPRIMLAFVHTPWWYKCPARVVLPENARSLRDEWANRKESPVEFHAHFVPENLDYRKVKFNPNFSSANKGYLKMLPKGIGMGYVFGADVETDGP